MASVADVLSGTVKWAVEASDATAWLQSMPDDAVDLVFFSPPYEAQRTYGVGCKLRGQAWVDWLRPIIVEAARVSSGLVCVNAAGPVVDRSYSPAMEWLVSDLTRLDGLVCGPAPWCWWKVCGIPGSGSIDYQRRDWEPVYAFCRPDRLPLKWSDNIAFGTKPKREPGGEFATRDTNGVRKNDPWKTASRGGDCGGRFTNGEKRTGVKRIRQPSGRMEEMTYSPPKIANPGNVIITDNDSVSNVITARVGGGHMGHDLAHDGEAPMPVMLAERFVCWYCPPGGVVADFFVGSGTTCHAAVLHGRRFVGCDVRENQCQLTRRRMATVTPNMFAEVAAGEGDADA